MYCHSQKVTAPLLNILQWLCPSPTIPVTSSLLKKSLAMLTSANYIAVLLLSVLQVAIWAAIIAFNVCKIYLLYYDHEYERILASQKWAIFIDPSLINNNWFLNNKNKYGNPMWLIKHIILPVMIIWIVIDLIITTIFDFYIFLVMFIWFIPHLIVGIRYWRKYPTFNDTLGIRKEIKVTLILASIYVIAVIVQSILTIYVDDSLWMTNEMLVSITLVTYSWIITIYPQRANEIGQSRNKQYVAHKSSNIEWRENISTMDGYEEFAAFLQREFSRKTFYL